MNPEQESRRALEARHILEHVLFTDARADFEARLKEARRAAPIGATELHTRLILLEQVGVQFFEYFELAVQTGKLADDQLGHDQRRQQRLAEAFAAFTATGRNTF